MANKPKKTAVTAFSYTSLGSSSGAVAFTFATEMMNEEDFETKWAFTSLPADEAIVDLGATQDLVGDEALKSIENNLAHLGLRAIKVDAPMVAPSGIGGCGKAVGVVLLTISPGGHPGVLEVTVLEGTIPPLLSVCLFSASHDHSAREQCAFQEAQLRLAVGEA